MASKKSIVDLLPKVGPNSEASDLQFRFNRHVTGDYLARSPDNISKEQKQEDLCSKLEKAEKPMPLVPPAGVPPPTAQQLMKLKKSQPDSAVDFCKPVEYQFLSMNERELNFFALL